MIAGKKIAIPDLHFESPAISLLRGSNGKNNWTFKNDDKPSPWQLKLQGIIISKGRVQSVAGRTLQDGTLDQFRY